ncbi:pyroglutamyl-peptidase [Microcella alkaliphila]|uniref:Pyrrolidone-carboxylate peptidase n=1 Tax=Microcella alkaliphila TaxID=279828 RepID=A0A4V6MCF6_9MICO|nr:pyroglutamyl-peptidase I [Microcella alkaliphila]RZT64399.1 pyroglutamyl-peptidase [Microcella alkaliphila]
MTETRTVLLTGFEPFGGDSTNPSGDVARALNGETLECTAAGAGEADTTDAAAHATVIGRVLPVSFAASAAQLEQLAAKHRPDLIIALGLADGREAITPERVAINYADARIPDNDGAQPRDEPLDPTGPAAHFTGLPVKRIARALTDAGHPATVSLTAGSYVCNAVAYHLGAIAERRTQQTGTPTPAGFIHVPNWPADRLTPAIRLAIATTLANPTDLDEAGGSIH